MVVSRCFYEACAGDVFGEVSGLFDANVPVAGAVNDERRDMDRGEDMAHIDFAVHAHDGDCGAGTGAVFEPVRPPGPEVGIGRRARGRPICTHWTTPSTA